MLGCEAHIFLFFIFDIYTFILQNLDMLNYEWRNQKHIKEEIVNIF
jgi:hypothetical protein